MSVINRGFQNNFMVLGKYFMFWIFSTEIAISMPKLLDISLMILFFKSLEIGTLLIFFFYFFPFIPTVKSVAKIMKVL